MSDGTANLSQPGRVAAVRRYKEKGITEGQPQNRRSGTDTNKRYVHAKQAQNGGLKAYM
jgi:hypothetical protein